MSGGELIDEYAAELSNRLPQPAVEELLDGLAETYGEQLTKKADELAAAQATIAAFGDPDIVEQAFIHHSPGRRLATLLLATGPLVGLAWAATILIPSRAWNWPIPLLGRITFGLALFVTIGMLLTTTHTRGRLKRSQTTARLGALTLIALDGTMIAAALLAAHVHPLALLPAAGLSIARVAFTAQRLHRLLTI
ncbi:MAG: hypothetical protein GEU79_11525 [Acidimicrobiia bacterium]|nr:hypothetical protein [Acidimicrobiia bacterium]